MNCKDMFLLVYVERKSSVNVMQDYLNTQTINKSINQNIVKLA